MTYKLIKLNWAANILQVLLQIIRWKIKVSAKISLNKSHPNNWMIISSIHLASTRIFRIVKKSQQMRQILHISEGAALNWDSSLNFFKNKPSRLGNSLLLENNLVSLIVLEFLQNLIKLNSNQVKRVITPPNTITLRAIIN